MTLKSRRVSRGPDNSGGKANKRGKPSQTATARGSRSATRAARNALQVAPPFVPSKVFPVRSDPDAPQAERARQIAGDLLSPETAAVRIVVSSEGKSATGEWLDVGGASPERIDTAYEGEGLRFQVEEVHRCLGAGLTESPVMSLDESVAIAGVLDAIRAQLRPGTGS